MKRLKIHDRIHDEIAAEFRDLGADPYPIPEPTVKSHMDNKLCLFYVVKIYQSDEHTIACVGVN